MYVIMHVHMATCLSTHTKNVYLQYANMHNIHMPTYNAMSTCRHACTTCMHNIQHVQLKGQGSWISPQGAMCSSRLGKLCLELFPLYNYSRATICCINRLNCRASFIHRHACKSVYLLANNALIINTETHTYRCIDHHAHSHKHYTV